MTVRTAQVESTLKRAIADIITREISDPRIVGMITVTKVDISPDLKQATVHVSVIPEKHEARTLQGLNHATKFIHTALIKRVSLRAVPALHFRLDRTIKKQAQIFEAIREGLESPVDVMDLPRDEPELDDRVVDQPSDAEDLPS